MPSNKSEHRRSSKPLMEKRRRARINQSLCELKSFILETAKKENCRRSKLEKADILELTVKHLQNLHKVQNNAQDDSKVTGKFAAGFNQCANEVNKFVSNLDGVDTAIRNRLLSHINKCVLTIDPKQETCELNAPTKTIDDPSATVSSTTICQPVSAIYPVKIEVPVTCTNSSQMNVFNGFQVITTSHLSNGDVALIVPSNALNRPNHESCTTVTQRVSTPSSSPSPSTESSSVSIRNCSVSGTSSDGEKSGPCSPVDRSYWPQPEQTSPLALSQRSIGFHNENRTDNSYWRPWHKL